MRESEPGMADDRSLLQRVGDFIRGPRDPSEKEKAARALVDPRSDPEKDLLRFESDLQLQYLLSIGVDFTPAEIRNLQIRARWGDPRWLYALYDQLPRLGPGPQIRKMIEAIRDTEDQYKTTPEDADEAEEGAGNAEIATEARDYVETVVSPWAPEIKAHMATAENYGVAAGEIVTDPRGLKWRGRFKERIVDFRPIAARRFRLDPASHEWLLTLSALEMQGVPVGPLVQRGKLLFYEVGKGVEPLDQRGLYYQLLLPWAILQYCVRWRAKRVEKYGVPPAIGKVNLADAKQKEQMRSALADFAASMYMVVGKDASVEFANALAQGRIDPQAALIDWCSQMYDMILLGDTQASQVMVGAGSKQSKDQAIGGFHDLTNSRVTRLNAAVFNRQLIPGLVFRNFGADVAAMNCPVFESTVSESDDAKDLAQAALWISQAGFGEKIDGEDLIQRCTLQVASEDDQEAAQKAALAKVAASKPAPPALPPGAGAGQKALPPAKEGEMSPGEKKKLVAAGPKAPAGESAKVFHFEPRRFAGMGDFQAPAAEPVVFPAPTLASPRIKLVSYGHENGALEGADSLVDARGLGYGEDEGYGNVPPAWTGRDPSVQGLIKGGDKSGPTYGGLKSATLRAIKAGEAAGKRELTVGVACDHGRHRSVYVAERLGHEMRLAGHDVTVEHRDADKLPLHGQMSVQPPERPKRTREAQQAIAAKVRAHLKVLHKKALEEGEKALAARATAK